MKTLFRNFIAIVLLIGIVYCATNYSELIEQQIGIKNFSQNNTKGIAGQVLGIATSQVNNATKNFNVTSFINSLPQNISNVKNFAQQEINSFTHKK